MRVLCAVSNFAMNSPFVLLLSCSTSNSSANAKNSSANANTIFSFSCNSWKLKEFLQTQLMLVPECLNVFLIEPGSNIWHAQMWFYKLREGFAQCCNLNLSFIALRCKWHFMRALQRSDLLLSIAWDLALQVDFTKRSHLSGIKASATRRVITG